VFLYYEMDRQGQVNSVCDVALWRDGREIGDTRRHATRRRCTTAGNKTGQITVCYYVFLRSFHNYMRVMPSPLVRQHIQVRLHNSMYLRAQATSASLATGAWSQGFSD
jgi:hypothetical protein